MVRARAQSAGGAPVSAVEVQVKGGVALPEGAYGAGQLYRVIPEQAATAIELTARAGEQEGRRTFAVGPAGRQVAIKLDPPAPVKGQDQEAALTIAVTDASGKPDPDTASPIVRASVGTVEPLQRVSPGVYRARYLLPDTRYPEVAVIAAFAAWPHAASVHGSFGALRVPLATSIELPGRAEANADTAVTIAGRKFGPVKTDAAGNFKVPVVVPPGYGRGTATTVDRLGNARTSQLDLSLPPTDQLACVVNPPQLPADGLSRARVVCAASDAFGKVVTGAKVQLAASRGKLTPPRPKEGGVVEWMLVAPPELGAKVALSAVWPQGGTASKESLAVEVVQGPPATLEVRAQERFVHQGFATRLELEVEDAQKRRRPGAVVELASGPGALEAAAEQAPGSHTAAWRAAGKEGPAELALRAWGPVGAVPAQLVAFAEGGQLFAATVDPAGLPVPGQPLRFNRQAFTTAADGCVALGPAAEGDHQLEHADWPGLATRVIVREGGKVVFPRAARPASAPAALAVEVGPPTPVDIRVRVAGGRVEARVVDRDGRPLPGRAVAVEASAGRVVLDGRDSAQVTFRVEGLSGPATVTIVDLQTQVSALVEVRP